MAAFQDVAIYEPLDQRGMYLVHSPHTSIPCTCDIIIVHGLNGGTAKSFTHPNTGTIWFQHLLPRDVSNSETRTNARIWVYGYNAATTFENAGNTTAFDQATNLLESVLNIRKEQRKIIWVCHSLGGIIVKTALFQANSKMRYKAILQDTIGTIFVGTPHQGSGYADVADVAQQIARVVLFKPKAILTGLKKNCNQLFETANNFADVSGNIRIFSFYETMRPEIVTKASASTRIPGEVLLSLDDVKHSDLCKFRDDRDPNYRRMRDCIKELMGTTNTPRGPIYFPWDEHRYDSTYSQHQQPPSRQTPYEPYPANTKYIRSPARKPVNPPYPAEATSSSYNPYLGSNTNDQSSQYSRSTTPSMEQPNSPSPYASTARSTPNPPSSEASQTQSRLSPVERTTSSQSAPPPDNRRPPPSAYRNTRSEQDVPHPSSSVEEEDPLSSIDIWTCDWCMDGIPADKPRAHCMVCDDYDLCIDCYKKDRISKTHRADHKMCPIVRTKIITRDELAYPSEEVNPYLPSEDSKSNWAIDEKDMRWDNLRSTNNHDRYLAGNIGPGYYRPGLILRLKLSNHLDASNKAILSKEGMGSLRVTIGFPKSKDIFLHKSFPENESLKTQLFSSEATQVIKLVPGNEGLFRVDMDPSRITIDQMKAELGVLLQWTDMRGFKNLKDPIAQIAIEQIRLEELFDKHTETAPSEPEAPAQEEASSTDADEAEQLGELFAQVLIQNAMQNQIRERQEREAREQQAREEAAAQFLLQLAREAQEEKEREERERAAILAARRQQQEREAAVNTIVGYAYLAALLDETNR